MAERIFKLSSNDGVTIQVKEECMMLSSTLSDLIQNVSSPDKEAIPLPNVNGSTLKRIVEWMKRKVDDKGTSTSNAINTVSTTSRHEDDKYDEAMDRSISHWEKNMFKNMGKADLFAMLNGANFLGIASLIDSGSSFVAIQLLGMDSEEARQYLNLQEECKKFGDEQAA